ncbi:hypothetical protein ABPG72_000026 [Tetrahymena utriculariae]
MQRINKSWYYGRLYIYIYYRQQRIQNENLVAKQIKPLNIIISNWIKVECKFNIHEKYENHNLVANKLRLRGDSKGNNNNNSQVNSNEFPEQTVDMQRNYNQDHYTLSYNLMKRISQIPLEHKLVIQ